MEGRSYSDILHLAETFCQVLIKSCHIFYNFPIYLIHLL